MMIRVQYKERRSTEVQVEWPLFRFKEEDGPDDITVTSVYEKVYPRMTLRVEKCINAMHAEQPEYCVMWSPTIMASETEDIDYIIGEGRFKLYPSQFQAALNEAMQAINLASELE
jgi:hypothetical protein